MRADFITIVSGLPRSGTSMMMQMLEAGGLAALTDGVRRADEDNPRGYYEFEPVKRTAQDASWLDRAGGKAVKMVYRLLYDLPEGRSYRVIFMQRNMEEVLASQNKMLRRLGRGGGQAGDADVAAGLKRDLAEFDAWLAARGWFSVLRVDYRDVLADPAGQAERVNRFLGGGLDEAAMARVVDGSLYRNRKP